MLRPYRPDDLEALLDVWYRASLIAQRFERIRKPRRAIDPPVTGIFCRCFVGHRHLRPGPVGTHSRLSGAAVARASVSFRRALLSAVWGLNLAAKGIRVPDIESEPTEQRETTG